MGRVGEILKRNKRNADSHLRTAAQQGRGAGCDRHKHSFVQNAARRSVEIEANARASNDRSSSVSISRDRATFATALRMRASCVKQLGLNSAA